MVEVELEGIAPPELGNTLSDVIGFLDVSSDPVSYAGTKPGATTAFLAPGNPERPQYNSDHSEFFSTVPRWTSSDARKKQKELYDSSQESPQCVERPDGKNAYIISEDHLKSLLNKNPLTALEMMAALKDNDLEPISLAETGRSRPMVVPNIDPII